jgi:MATE family multidrug resistance protein
MGHSPEQVDLEKSYYTILMFSSFLTLAKVCLASFFSGIGRTRVVMVCDVAGILLNVPLCYILVFGKFGLPAMGIEGAALSTVISTFFTLGLFLNFYLSKKNRARYSVDESFAFDRGITRRYIKLGFPSGLEVFLNVAAFNLFLLMFQSYGIPEAASATIVFNWDILSFVPLLGLNIAVMSLIGRAVGAGNMDMANAVTTSGYVLGLVYSVILATLYLLFRNNLVELFIFQEADAVAIRELSRFMMIGLSCYVLCEGVLQVASAVLRGAGDTRWAMYASVSLHWLMLVTQFFIIKVFDLGARVSWVAFVVMILALALVFVLRLASNRWRDPERLRLVMAE